MFKPLFLLILSCLLMITPAMAQDPATPVPAPVTGPSMVPSTPLSNDSVLVTIMLKHQQDKNLPEIRRVLEAQGFWDMFPPAESRVVSWTIAMGLGHVIILQVPLSSVRRLNLALENGAWGAFDTEIYLTYDYQPVWHDYIQRRQDAKAERDDD